MRPRDSLLQALEGHRELHPAVAEHAKREKADQQLTVRASLEGLEQGSQSSGVAQQSPPGALAHRPAGFLEALREAHRINVGDQLRTIVGRQDLAQQREHDRRHGRHVAQPPDLCEIERIWSLRYSSGSASVAL